jgi:hypothetical protein
MTEEQLASLWDAALIMFISICSYVIGYRDGKKDEYTKNIRKEMKKGKDDVH